MSKRSLGNNSEYRDEVQKAIDSGKWIFDRGTKHKSLRHVESGRLLTYPSSATCPRAIKNFRRDMRYIEAGIPGFGQSKEIVGITLPKKAKAARISR